MFLLFRAIFVEFWADNFRVSCPKWFCTKLVVVVEINEDKRLFSVSFRVVNNVLEKSRKLRRLRDDEEEEFVLLLSQFATV